MGKSSNDGRNVSSSAPLPPHPTICKLRKLMSNRPDITLVFDNPVKADKLQSNKLAVHTCLLRLHSEVLKEALDVSAQHVSSASSGSSSSKNKRKDSPLRELAMPGTSAADFTKVLEFMYPVIPPPQVCWDNLEALLVQGHKWNMPYILHLAEKFLVSNVRCTTSDQNSQKYVFKWLRLTDAAKLTKACIVCCDHVIFRDRKQCTIQNLEGLSPLTLKYLVARLAGADIESSFPLPLLDSSHDSSEDDSSDI